jgi:hypothetical protein
MKMLQTCQDECKFTFAPNSGLKPIWSLVDVLVTKITSHVHLLTFARFECISKLVFIVKDKQRMHKFVNLIRAKREKREFECVKKEAHERKCVQSKESVCIVWSFVHKEDLTNQNN